MESGLSVSACQEELWGTARACLASFHTLDHVLFSRLKGNKKIDRAGDACVQLEIPLPEKLADRQTGTHTEDPCQAVFQSCCHGDDWAGGTSSPTGWAVVMKMLMKIYVTIILSFSFLFWISFVSAGTLTLFLNDQPLLQSASFVLFVVIYLCSF